MPTMMYEHYRIDYDRDLEGPITITSPDNEEIMLPGPLLQAFMEHKLRENFEDAWRQF